MLRVLSLSVVLILVSCSSNDDNSNPPDSEATLLGNGWRMTSYALNGQSEREALDMDLFRLSFKTIQIEQVVLLNAMRLVVHTLLMVICFLSLTLQKTAYEIA